MIAVTEHITRADSFQDIPILSKILQVSCQRCRISTDIHTSLRNVPPLSRYFAGTTSSAAPAKNSTLDISFNAAFSRAFFTACSTISTPYTLSAFWDKNKEIVPIPQYGKSCKFNCFIIKYFCLYWIYLIKRLRRNTIA